MAVGNETAAGAVNAGAKPAHTARRWRLPGWLVVPRGETAVRLVLVGIALAFQNYLEFPRNGLNDWLGKPLASIFAFVALAASLTFLVLALRDRVPRWRWLRARWMQVAVLVVTLAACPTGLHQLGVIATAGFQAPQYSNDGTTLDHYAAMQLLEGHNPYVTVSIVSANAALGQDALHTTPLRQGKFATIPWDSYPTKQQIQSVFQSEPAGDPAKVPEFESHVSYPALAFLPLVPFVWAGFPSVVPFFALCLLALVALLVLAAPKELRPWIVLLALADAPLLDATVTGDLDVFYILLLFVAWRWWRKPLLSAVFLGLALAAKQLAWFFLPFYAILVWRERGWREAVARLAGAGAIFAAINLPFVLNNPHAWLAGILAPEVDPMFPGGNGLIRLSLGGILPLAPSPVYTTLEVMVMIACLVWYWRYGRQTPE
ncbi:MAG TPA: glycosyltransferase 87 family protein, partial [Ktedonobacterales bacterium]|nr:glycosyltransferase 87 family protein [Ktedonobacterales bacterium]